MQVQWRSTVQCLQRFCLAIISSLHLYFDILKVGQNDKTVIYCFLGIFFIFCPSLNLLIIFNRPIVYFSTDLPPPTHNCKFCLITINSIQMDKMNGKEDSEQNEDYDRTIDETKWLFPRSRVNKTYLTGC